MPYDVLVIGGGISGASFAYHAARAGRRVLVLEREARAGGCLCTARTPSGYWYELGAHTCYNSYGAFLELLEGCGSMATMQARGKPVLRFLEENQVQPGKNLGLLLRRFDKLEFLRALPRWRGARKEGQSVRSYYARLVGARNYERVLGPMLSAVPSQTADELPVEMLFKKRARRKDVLRSFTLQGGLQSVVENVLRQPGIETRLGQAVREVARTGAGLQASLADGTRVEASVLALAVPPVEATRLLGPVAPRAAACVSTLKEVAVESLGFALPIEQAHLPYTTFLVPLDDRFHSVVTRDVVPDPRLRAFTFHFRPETTRAERLRRAAEVLGLRLEELPAPAERRAVLPSPRIGHAAQVHALDRELAGQRLAVTGNWFTGLAIEDCVLRSRAEWQRVTELG